MIVYRVENAERRGPWSARLCDRVRWDRDSKHNEFPRVIPDVVPHPDAIDWWPHARCAVHVFDLLREWFDMWEQYVLDVHGFSVTTYETNGVHLVGQYQCIFDARVAVPVGTTKLRDL